ncbi:MAG: hypothetical protein ABSG38_18110 [Spirochaetia bacterium]|jgi:hypothetical protein
MGKALLKATEDEVRRLGSKGLVVWGVSLPVFMRASWFRKQGYRQVDSHGMMKLLWKSFTTDAIEPKWIRQKRKPAGEAGRVVVTALRNGWCPGQNLAAERAKRAAGEFKKELSSKRLTPSKGKQGWHGKLPMPCSWMVKEYERDLPLAMKRYEGRSRKE